MISIRKHRYNIILIIKIYKHLRFRNGHNTTVSSKNTTNYLTVAGTSVEFSAGLGMDPVETSDWIPMTVPYIADGHVGWALSDVPERDLAAHQTTGQALRVPVVELERDDRMWRFNRKIRSGGVLWNSEARNIQAVYD